ncbi:MAG: isocitrate lyase/PEP mutase family protein [Bacillota bacterium]
MRDYKAKRFRELLGGEGTLLRPCAYDALSAIIIEKAGFLVVGTTGYGISASLIGQPDMGFVDFSSMLERARTIVNAISAPLDVDVDTGYGNELNVNWAVRNFIRVGVASVRIEDQVWPKRCGHMEGKSVIPCDAMVRKIIAAVRARDEEGCDIVLGARTDARGPEGLEATLERATAYARAGADYVYVEAPQSLDEIKLLKKEVPVPLALNVIPGGSMPNLSIDELEEVGVDFLSIPMIALYPAAKAMQEALEILRDQRDLAAVGQLGVSWAEFNEIVGFEGWSVLESELAGGVRDVDSRTR